MKRNMVINGVLVLLFLGFVNNLRAEDRLIEKKKAEALEKFVASTRKSDGDYSTISLRNWRNETDLPIMSTEDMIRKVLNAFESHYKNLRVIDYSIVYTNKTGPSGGVECDFLIIHHETKPVKVFRFGTKDKESTP